MISNRKISEILFDLNITSNLDNFKEYSNLIESKINEQMEGYDEKIKTIKDDEELEEYMDSVMDEVYMYREEFPFILRNSLLTMLYSFLENSLIDFCKSAGEHKIKLKDINGKGIFQAQTYIKKVLSLDFPDQSKEWNTIIKINVIRNCIVHNAGNAEKISPKELADITNFFNNAVTVDNRNRLVLNKHFCINFANVIRDFLWEIYIQIQKQKPTRKN